ncbi:PIG-L deacetylase family protein [Candidatus Latescibacterota bacterium]
MERRKFIGSTLAGGAIFGGYSGLNGSSNAYAQSDQKLTSDNIRFAENLVIERDVPGQPHKGKVLAIIHEHADDAPLGCAGTIAKLIKEGYTAYLIRVTNDMEDPSPTLGRKVAKIDLDHQDVGKALGIKKIYDFAYRKHHLDEISIHELTGRLIYLFRMLEVDTIITHDPWKHYDINPDHTVTANAVRAACWMSNEGADYPEFIQSGLAKKGVKERYYYGVGPMIQYNFTLVNRIVDISSVIDKKVEANLANKNWGPHARSDFKTIKDSLTNGREGQLGRHFGLEYAEAYVYQSELVL